MSSQTCSEQFSMLKITEPVGRPLEAMNQYIDKLLIYQGQLTSRIADLEKKYEDVEKFIESVIQREKEEAEQEGEYEDEPPLNYHRYNTQDKQWGT